MAKGHHRSAITGRHISKAVAARHPRTSVTENGRNRSTGIHHRSAVTGRFVSKATAARHPYTTVTEHG